MAILQVDFGGLHRGTVRLDRALVLGDQGHLGIESLARHGVLCRQALVAGQVNLGAFQQRFVARQIALRLRQRGLIGPRVDFREQIAFLDVLALP